MSRTRSLSATQLTSPRGARARAYLPRATAYAAADDADAAELPATTAPPLARSTFATIPTAATTSTTPPAESTTMTVVDIASLPCGGDGGVGGRGGGSGEGDGDGGDGGGEGGAGPLKPLMKLTTCVNAPPDEGGVWPPPASSTSTRVALAND